ncbi:B-cell linker protein-like [Carcharodon carcharias]|uniref:B-cell linker protein-like n=1 Tax=Carcharodon carcharias TaxID=13397 RepID=UPI001B7E510E|nr:B-cell linker protein-like [Carcharodon carcharias]
MAVDLKRNPKIFYRHENDSEDEDAYEPPPTERPLRIVTTIEPINNNDYIGKAEELHLAVVEHAVRNVKSDSDPANMRDLYIDPKIAKGFPMNQICQGTPPIIPARIHNQYQSLTQSEDKDADEYLKLNHVESSGSKSLPDPRPQLSIPPRGANSPTSVPKPSILFGKPFCPKPPISPEEMSIPPLTGKGSQIKSNVLVPTPFTQSVPFPSMQQGSLVNTRTGLMYSPSIFAENTNLSSKPWYASKCDRKTAEAVLHENGKDGAFLVRPSSGCDRNQPYTLAILYRGKVYNIPIRFIEGNNQYALGKEKAGEMWFNSVQGMISYYQQNILILIDQQNNIKDSILLLYPVRL